MPSMSPSYPPGSEVLEMDPNTYEFTQVYLDDGWQFMGSSISVFWGDNILMGSPSANFMECHRV
jgi:hypothetical protein